MRGVRTTPLVALSPQQAGRQCFSFSEWNAVHTKSRDTPVVPLVHLVLFVKKRCTFQITRSSVLPVSLPHFFYRALSAWSLTVVYATVSRVSHLREQNREQRSANRFWVTGFWVPCRSTVRCSRLKQSAMSTYIGGERRQCKEGASVSEKLHVKPHAIAGNVMRGQRNHGSAPRLM